MAASINSSTDTKAKPVRQSAKKASGSPGIGHNGAEPLTEEEHEALQLHHELKVRAQMKKAGVAKASYDLEKNEVNALVKKACAEIKVLSGEFREYLADKDLDAVEYRKKALTRSLLRKRGGMPDVHGQYSLELPTKADTVDDKKTAYDDGFRAGKRADDPLPRPSHVAAIFHGEWDAGWADGQKDNVLKLGIADKVIARLAAPKVEAKPEPEKSPEDERVELDAQARALKKAGFMDLTEPNASVQ